MKPRLDLALDAIARTYAKGGDFSEILRTDVDPSGALVLCCARASSPVWLQLDGERLVERHPAEDPLLPLATELRIGSKDRQIEVLSYRPGRRLVLLCTDGRSARIEKGYRRQRWKAAALRHRIAENATSDKNGFRVPRLQQERDTQASLTFEHLTGLPISVTETNVETFYAIGRALRCFQEAPEFGGDPAVFGPEDEVHVLERWAERARDLTSTSCAGRIPVLTQPICWRI